MKISVVMTTYNGESYIYEQIRSIYEQTRKPDEVLICDDGSTDETVSLLEAFIEEHHLENWRVIVNEENKGWQRNFIEALDAVSGSLIFFSDQDDIWYEDKIEVMSAVVEKNPKVKCLSGKMTTIDEKGNVFQGRNTFSSGDGTGELTECRFSTAFNTTTLLGCTMCITNEVADIIRELGVKDYGHDAQCARLGVLLQGAYTLDRAVIHYRLHGGNTSGVVADINYGSASLEKRKNDIEKNIIWLEKLMKFSEKTSLFDSKRREIIGKTIHFQRERLEFLNSQNIFRYLKLLKYRKYYSGVAMYVGDFAYGFHINRVAGKVLWKIKNKEQ